jgi:hypothetical protein
MYFHKNWIDQIIKDNSDENLKFIEIKREKKISEPISSFNFGKIDQNNCIKKCIYANETIIASWGCNRMTMHQNGSLKIYRNRKPFILYWSSNTDGKGAEKACMLENGNFVILNEKNETIWETGTFDEKNCLRFIDDGRFVIIGRNGNSLYEARDPVFC